MRKLHCTATLYSRNSIPLDVRALSAANPYVQEPATNSPPSTLVAQGSGSYSSIWSDPNTRPAAFAPLSMFRDGYGLASNATGALGTASARLLPPPSGYVPVGYGPTHSGPIAGPGALAYPSSAVGGYRDVPNATRSSATAAPAAMSALQPPAFLAQGGRSPTGAWPGPNVSPAALTQNPSSSSSYGAVHHATRSTPPSAHGLPSAEQPSTSGTYGPNLYVMKSTDGSTARIESAADADMYLPLHLQHKPRPL